MLDSCELCNNNPAIVAGYCVECVMSSSDVSGLPLELVINLLLDGTRLVKSN